MENKEKEKKEREKTSIPCPHAPVPPMFWKDSPYTVLQKYAHIGLKQNLLRSTTLDIIPGLLDIAAFVCVHVVGRFSKDFSEVRGLKSLGFQLQVEWMTTVLCAEV